MRNKFECLVNGIVRADEEIRTRAGQLLCGRHHQLRDAGPVVLVNELHVLGQGVSVQRDLGMVVAPEQLRAFQADGAITQRGAFRAACDDADVLGHECVSIDAAVSGGQFLN